MKMHCMRVQVTRTNYAHIGVQIMRILVNGIWNLVDATLGCFIMGHFG